MRPTDRRRRGFTLIELLVAAALALVVMTVLSLAFQTGLQTLSQLKSVVGMAEQLRSAEAAVRADLGAQHLETGTGTPLRLPAIGQVTDRRGYFQFRQGDPSGNGPALEGVQAQPTSDNRLGSFRTPAFTGANSGRGWGDFLQFTSRLPGDRPQAVFTARVDPTIFGLVQAGLPPELRSADPTGGQVVGQWAEVAYFLIPAGTAGTTPPGPPKVFTSDEGGVPPLPLYALYRRQRVLLAQSVVLGSLSPSNPAHQKLVRDSAGLAVAVVGGQYVAVGMFPSTPTATDSVRDHRLGGATDPLAPAAGKGPYPVPAGAADFGADLMVSNVLSFAVRPVYAMAGLTALTTPAPTVALTPDLYTFLPGNGATDYQPRDMLEIIPVPVSPALPVIPTTPAWASPRSFDTQGSPGLAVLRPNQATSPVYGTAVGLATLADRNSITLKGVEIKLRVYDAKNKTSRQMTVLQDL